MSHKTKTLEKSMLSGVFIFAETSQFFTKLDIVIPQNVLPDVLPDVLPLSFFYFGICFEQLSGFHNILNVNMSVNVCRDRYVCMAHEALCRSDINT